MKRSFFVLTACLLSACTTIQDGTAQKAAPVVESAAPQAASPVVAGNNAAEAKGATDTQPAEPVTEEGWQPVTLTKDMLYELLVANFAYKQGDYRKAYDGMKDAAIRTGDPRLAKRAVEIALKGRHNKEALDAIRLWHELAPESTEAEKYLIGFLVLEGQLDELEAFLSNALAKAKPNERGPLMLQYQQFLSSSKEKSQAFRVMEKITEPYRDNADAHIALSLMAFTNKDNARAEAEAKEALRLKPDSELAVLTLAQAEADPVRSIQTLTEFLKKYPNAREVRISNARMLIAQKEYDRARREFEQVLATQPDDLQTLYAVGLLSIQQNDYPNAQKYLTRYLDLGKKSRKSEMESYQAIFLLAQMAEERKNYDAALTWLDRISEEQDSEAWMLAQIKKGQILFKQGKVKEARAHMAGLRYTYPAEEERLLLSEAQMLRTAKMNQEAYTLLKNGVKKNPDSMMLLYDFALAAEKVNHVDEMEKSLRRILELDPNNQMAYNALGYSLADRNVRLDEAYVLIAKALALSPDDPYVTDSMGWVLYRQGKLKEAELLLRRAYELMPEAEVMVHLGEVLWVSGQQEDARRFFKEAAKKEPDSEILSETVKRLGVKY